MKVGRKEQVNVMEAYEIELMSLAEIGAVFQVTPQAIKKILNKNGVDTSKRKLLVSCTVCGTVLERTRKRIRNQMQHFCDRDCYASYLEAGRSGYAQNRHATRIGRRVVARLFNLQQEHVVHHEDGNNFNNDPENLRVFATNGDHIRYHHAQRIKRFNPVSSGFTQLKRIEVLPIWQG